MCWIAAADAGSAATRSYSCGVVIFILGGTAVVSTGVEDDLETLIGAT